MGVASLAVKIAKKAAKEVAEKEAPAVAKTLAVKAPAIVKSVEGSAKRKAATYNFDRERLKEQYPEVPPGVPTVDPKSGKAYIAKGESAETLAVQKAIAQIRKDMKNGYEPMFDLNARSYVDPANYPLQGRTLTDAIPAKEITRAQYEARVNQPGTLENLSRGYEAAADDPLAHDWYAMRQLEEAYIDELGPEAGRAAFRSRFAEGMAATTGGADPTSNYLMTQYGNFQNLRGLPVPTTSYDVPYPIGGRFAKGNLGQFNKFIVGGSPLTAKGNPKRFDFAGNFMGHRDRATIDEQMSGAYVDLADEGKLMPPTIAYGHYEQPVHDLAEKYGVTPANFQEVTWAGLKGVGGKPMMSHINDAIERTSRLTGMDPEDVLRLSIVRGEAPTFAEGGHVDRAALAERYNYP